MRSMRWVRETMVGRIASGWSVSRKYIVFGGGSSSDFRKALALSLFSRSAPETMPTFQPPEKEVEAIGSTMRSRIESMVMMRFLPSGSRVTTSGWTPAAIWSRSSGKSFSSTLLTSSAALPRTSPTTR